MKTVGNYFSIQDNQGEALKDNIIAGKKYRITILTERLIRFEYSKNGVFRNEITGRVINRKFPRVEYNVSQTDTLLQVDTNYFNLLYVKENSFKGSKLSPEANLKLTLKNTDHVWYYGHPEARNFGGIPFSLDDFSGKLRLSKGLYSTDGFATLDDSDTYLIDSNGKFKYEKNNDYIDLYVFMYKKDLGLCLNDYYKLTGLPMLINRNSLGVYWYKNHLYNNNEYKKLIDEFVSNDIALSNIVIGKNNYLKDDLYTIDGNLNYVDLFNLCKGNQIGLASYVDPSVLVKRGTPFFNTLVSMGADSALDYSFIPANDNSLNVFGNCKVRSMLSSGIDSIFIDYNKSKIDLAMFNHYTYALSCMILNKRESVFVRNHDIAIHREGIVYAGETFVDWNTLSILPFYLQTASNNALSYVSYAIGGYKGGIENFELYMRYIQLGVFSPIFLLSCDDGIYYRREPLCYGISEKEIIKKYLNLRNKLIPYLYTESYIYSSMGSPLIQPLYYKYPKIYDEPMYRSEYFLGNNFLICPIIKKKNTVMDRTVQRLFIPSGVWYEFESGKKYLGNKYYMSFYKIEDYPVFVREGSIIPMSLDKGTGNVINMEVMIFPGADGVYTLYEDDGVSLNYQKGMYSLTEYKFKYETNVYSLSVSPASNINFTEKSKNYVFRFRNTSVGDIKITSGGALLEYNSYVNNNDLVIEVKNVNSINGLSLTISSDGILMSSLEKYINDDIRAILMDLEIETRLKEKIGAILFSDLSVKKKRIAIRKLKKFKLETKFIKMFLNLLEYVDTI